MLSTSSGCTSWLRRSARLIPGRPGRGRRAPGRALGEGHAVGLGVPAPVAHVGGLEGSPQVLLAGGQGPLGVEPTGDVAQHDGHPVEHRERSDIDRAIQDRGRRARRRTPACRCPHHPAIDALQARPVLGRQDLPQHRADQFGLRSADVPGEGVVVERDPPLPVDDMNWIGQLSTRTRAMSAGDARPDPLLRPEPKGGEDQILASTTQPSFTCRRQGANKRCWSR